MLDATFARSDLTTFCRLEQLGLEVHEHGPRDVAGAVRGPPVRLGERPAHVEDADAPTGAAVPDQLVHRDQRGHRPSPSLLVVTSEA